MSAIRPPEARPSPAKASALSLGTQLAAGMVFFAGLGYYADYRRGGGVLFTVIGMFAGLGYGGYEVWKLVRQLNAEAREEESTTTK